MWDSFKRDYGKSYETMEEEFTRFNKFVMNLRIADKRNQEDTAIHGITKFFDLSQQEFRDRYWRADPSKKVGGAPVLEISTPPRADLGLVDWEGNCAFQKNFVFSFNSCSIFLLFLKLQAS